MFPKFLLVTGLTIHLISLPVFMAEILAGIQGGNGGEGEILAGFLIYLGRALKNMGWPGGKQEHYKNRLANIIMGLEENLCRRY